MWKSRLGDEQIIATVREAGSGAGDERVSAPRCQQGDAAALKYRGIEVQEAKSLHALEEANRRLKRLVAALALGNSRLKDVVGRTR